MDIIGDLKLILIIVDWCRSSFCLFCLKITGGKIPDEFSALISWPTCSALAVEV